MIESEGDANFRLQIKGTGRLTLGRKNREKKEAVFRDVLLQQKKR